ncbi:LIM domain only protein 7-like isoform X1 [Takifugu flavidus]|uniref:LIM domain only protein 7-like isoform X1 n=1 Tax=Takifugu flavidus TaxID=433684 RepID=UPI0025448F15|nr:LIM domain only protein 7-like isoform X1 [Takifugu flavidus]
MEWRQQSSVSCAHAFIEAQRWIEEVTGKWFGCNDFRAALENGVLLCDLINKLKPGIIKKVNRRSTPIAGLDNVNVFLKACGKLGLNVSQLFDPGDLQDLSTRVTLRHNESKRRLKNVLITIYWLGRKAHLDAFYSGPQLNFKAFEGLLGLALSRALDEGANLKDGWYPDGEEDPQPRRRSTAQTSVDSGESPRNLHPSSEGCESDAEAEQVFKMETAQLSPQRNRGRIPPPPPQRKQSLENGQYCTSPLARANTRQVTPGRPVQVNPGWIWSKSLSDIPMVYPVRKVPRGRIGKGVGRGDDGREWNSDKDLCTAVAEDGDAQWQDDLTKWKNRRRSTKSDLRRKSQDREHVINQMTNSARTNFERTEAGVPLERAQQSPSSNGPAPRAASSSSPSKPSGFDLQPRTRALLTRSYVTEVTLSPAASVVPLSSTNTQRATAGAMPASDGAILEEGRFASLASNGAGVTTPSLEFPFSSQTQVKGQISLTPAQPSSKRAQPESGPNQISSSATTIQLNGPFDRDPSEFCADPKVHQAPVYTPENRQNLETSGTSVERGPGPQVSGRYKYLAQTGSWARSASLPRGYRRSEGSCRLSSAITARPFGNKQSRVSSLSRLHNVDDNQGPLSKRDKDGSPSPPFRPSLKRQAASASLKVSPPAPSRQNNGNQTTVTDATPFQTPPQVCSSLQDNPGKSPTVLSNPCSDHTQVGHSFMRVSLTLKPNSRSDFGFQTRRDSRGATVQFIQPGSPAELCQLRVDDEIVTLNGVPVAHMSSSEWMEKMTSSLRAGSLTMDVRRYGNKDWSSSVGSRHKEPGQSRTTLNLTAAAPALIGRLPAHGAEIPAGKASELSGQTDGASGHLELSSAGDARSGARQANGGALSPVQVAHGKVARGEFADNHRTARSEVDYNTIIRINHRRRAEFFQEKGGSESAISDLQVPSLSPSSSSWMWNYEEERRRQQKWQEEQERLLQEKYQRDQERLEAEWQRAQQDAMEEEHREDGKVITSEASGGGRGQLMNGRTSRLGEQDQTPHSVTVTSDPRCDAQAAQNGRNIKGWAEECCDFARLSPSHRAKSMSTPSLAAAPKQTRGEERKRREPSVSKVEQQRQQILEEMKKRTQLLTDNSWIRQRSSSVYKEPIYVPLKRFESLDNLDAFQHSSALQNYPRPHSAAAGYYSPSRNPSRYSTGSVLPRTNDPTRLVRYASSSRAATDLPAELRPKSETQPHTAGSAISSPSALLTSPRVLL